MNRSIKNDLQYVESLPECGKFTMKDWELLRLDLSEYIKVPDATNKSKMLKPLEDIYNYYMDTIDISPKFCTSALLFLLSSACELDNTIMFNQGEMHLNLWFLTIGPSSISRKTTVERRNKRVLDDADLETFTSTFTSAAIFDVLGHTSQGAMFGSEFSKLLKQFKQKFYDDLPETLCMIYDCEPEISRFTKTNKEETIEDPYITYWGSTTPRSYELLTEDLFSQGYLFRFLYCLELEKYTWYDYSFDPASSSMNTKNIEALLRAVSTKFAHIRGSKGTTSWKAYQKYCNKIARMSVRDDRSIVYSYYGRVLEFVLKIAGVLELSRAAFIGIQSNNRNEITLTDTTLNLAVRIVRLYEQEFRNLIKKVRIITAPEPVYNENPTKTLVLNCISMMEGGVASFPELMTASGLSRYKLEKVTDGLVEEGVLEWTIATKMPTGTRGSKPKLYWTPINVKATDTQIAQEKVGMSNLWILTRSRM